MTFNLRGFAQRNPTRLVGRNTHFMRFLTDPKYGQGNTTVSDAQSRREVVKIRALRRFNFHGGC
jgi:hypothetical protein